MKRVRNLAWMLYLPLLAGCVAFENLPSGVTQGCDERLAGSWNYVDDRLRQLGHIDIDPGCRLHRPAFRSEDGTFSLPEVTAAFVTIEKDGRQYAVLRPKDAGRLADITKESFTNFFADSYVLLRYEVSDNRLAVYTPQIIEIGAAVRSGYLAGKQNDVSLIELTIPAGEVADVLSSDAGYYDGKPLSFVRTERIGSPQ